MIFGKGLNVRVQYFVESFMVEEEKANLPHIIINTPAVINNFYKKRLVKLNNIAFFILDDAYNLLLMHVKLKYLKTYLLIKRIRSLSPSNLLLEDLSEFPFKLLVGISNKLMQNTSLHKSKVLNHAKA